ncbi:MAG: DHH family phosphoesterase [Planctomycetota bacterium]
MVDNADFQKALALIDKSSNVLLTTHTRPDGDACGCVVAMAEMLSGLGKSAGILLFSEAPQWYEFLFGKPPTVLGKDVNVEQLMKSQFAEADLLMILDTNSYSQLPQLDQYLKSSDKPVLVIDHHVTSDGLGQVELVDTSAAAAGVIVLDLFKYAKWPVSEKVAEALFVAIATDTGWFHLSNTDSRTLRAAAELIDAGAVPAKLYHDLCQNYSESRLRLMAAMLQTLELHFDGRYACQHLTVADFEHTGAAYADTENLIDECRRIGTVEVAALFVELKDGRIRCSLRSRGLVDVRLIAQRFGGGGHKMASGAYLPGPLDNAKEAIVTVLTHELDQTERKRT